MQYYLVKMTDMTVSIRFLTQGRIAFKWCRFFKGCMMSGKSMQIFSKRITLLFFPKPDKNGRILITTISKIERV